MPLTNEEKRYTAWQEAARKHIERAFGVLQCRFQVMARPFLGHCEDNQQGRLIMLDNAQYVRFRQGHGWRRICQVQSCKQGDGRRGRRRVD